MITVRLGALTPVFHFVPGVLVAVVANSIVPLKPVTPLR